MLAQRFLAHEWLLQITMSQVKLSKYATTTQDDENYTCLVTNDVGRSSDMSKSFIQGEANSSVDFVLITTMKQFYRMKHSTATLNDKSNKAKHNRR